MTEERQAGWLALAQSGDMQALERLLEPYRPLLYALARRFHGSVLTAQELVQAGYVGLIEAVHRYDGSRGTRFITYAVPWALGEMKRALRESAQRTLSLEEETGPEAGRTLRDTLAGAEGMSIESLDLHMAIAQLTQEEQSVLLLRFYQDKTQKETAQALGRSQAQICRIEQRALDGLRARLA